MRFNFTSKRFSSVYLERVEGHEKYVTVDGGEKKLKKNWQALLRTVNFATLMILVRPLLVGMSEVYDTDNDIDQNYLPSGRFRDGT